MSNIAKGQFTARRQPASIDIGAAAAAASAISKRRPLACPLEKYAEIAAMPGFPSAPGWRLVIIPLKPPTQTAGGIVLADETIFANEVLCDVGYVASVGPAAYQDERFGGSPWCKVGDWVNYGRLSGKDIIFFGTDGEEHRIHVCNDRDVLTVIPDPTALKVY